MLDLVRNDDVEALVQKREAEGFQRQETFESLSDLEAQKRRLGNAVKREDLDIRHGHAFDFDLDGEVTIQRDESNMHKGLYFHPLLEANFRKFIIEPVNSKPRHETDVSCYQPANSTLNIYTTTMLSSKTAPATSQPRKCVSIFDVELTAEQVYNYLYEPAPEPDVVDMEADTTGDPESVSNLQSKLRSLPQRPQTTDQTQFKLRPDVIINTDSVSDVAVNAGLVVGDMEDSRPVTPSERWRKVSERQSLETFKRLTTAKRPKNKSNCLLSCSYCYFPSHVHMSASNFIEHWAKKQDLLCWEGTESSAQMSHPPTPSSFLAMCMKKYHMYAKYWLLARIYIRVNLCICLI